MDSEPNKRVLGKRKAPKDNNIKCEVCGDKVERATFGASTCKPCTNFFDRHIRKANPSPQICRRGENCEITPETRGSCSSCRLKKCEKVGMREIRTETSKRVQLFCKVCDGKTPFEMACGRCRKIFGRLFGMPMKMCKNEMECKITHQSRLDCTACFYNRCLAVGLTSADIRILGSSPEQHVLATVAPTVPQVQYPEYQEVVTPVPEVIVQEEYENTLCDDGPCKLCRRKSKTNKPFDGIQMCRRCTLVVTKNASGEPLDLCQRGDGICRQKFLIVHCFACLFKEYKELKGGINLPTTVTEIQGLCKLCDKPPKNIPHKMLHGIQMCRRCSLFIRQRDEGEPLEECSRKYEECKNHFPVVNCLACIYKKYKELVEQDQPGEKNSEQQALWKRYDDGTYYYDGKDPTTVTQTVPPGSSHDHHNQEILTSGDFIPEDNVQLRNTVPEMYRYQVSSVMSSTEEPEPEMYQYRPMPIPEYSEPDISQEVPPTTSSETYQREKTMQTTKMDHHHPSYSNIPLLDAGRKMTIPPVNSDHDGPFWDPQLDEMLSLESYLNTFDPSA